MNTLRHILGAAAIAAVSLTLASCEHKELCYDHSHIVPVNVVFDWTNAPDADPQSMEVYFYPKEGGTVQRFAFSGRDGGSVRLPYGDYDVLCLNTDLTATLYRGAEAWETFEVYTRDASLLEGMGVRTSGEPPRAEGAENESCALEPDMLWTGRLENVTVTATENQTVTLRPEQSVTRFTYRITNAENLDHVTSISGSLSGLSRGFFLGTAVLDEECVTVPFAAQSDRVSTVTGGFLGFGHCPGGDEGTPHMFVIYAVLDDGSPWYYTVDVTDQVHDPAQKPRHIHIELDGLPLPTPITNGSGMKPNVDDWQDVIVDLPM